MQSRFKFRQLLGASALTALALVGSSAMASVVLNVVEGRLLGASGVTVAGFANTFSVNFRIGSCVDVFNGCDAPADFTFTDQAASLAASQALLDQVLVGAYDDSPSLTGTCTVGASPIRCAIYTPFRRDADTPTQQGAVIFTAADNWSSTSAFPDDRLFLTVMPPETEASRGAMWAVWTPTAALAVPEPGVLPLSIAALLAMLLVRTRKGGGHAV